MTPRSSLAIACLVVVALLAPVAGASHAYSYTKTYTGTAGVTAINCDGNLDRAAEDALAQEVGPMPTPLSPHVPDNAGGACFRVAARATQQVSVVDTSGLAIAAQVQVSDNEGRIVLVQEICGSGAITTPDNGRNMMVAVLAPGHGQVACGTGAVAGAPTTGTITVSW